MSIRHLVLAGNHLQFNNFLHVFGPDFHQIQEEADLQTAQISGERRLVLCIGTWAQHPMRDRVLAWVNEKDRDGRPRGQCFAMLGRPGQ